MKDDIINHNISINKKGNSMITFDFANELKETSAESINRLADACIAYEGLTLSRPDLSGEDTQVYQFFESKKQSSPLGVLIAYPCEEYTEITAFTHPDFRCQGIFTSLFSRFLEKNGEGPVCFYPDGCSYDALCTLEVLDCEYSGTEQLMSCDLKSRPRLPFSPAFRLNVCDDPDLLAPIHSSAFGLTLDESREFLQESLQDDAVCWLITNEDTPVGMCLGSADKDTVYLYGLCMDPKYQHQGMGTDALALLLDCLSDVYRTVKVQVTEENEAAYRLYCRAGFVSTQELMEYWY